MRQTAPWVLVCMLAAGFAVAPCGTALGQTAIGVNFIGGRPDGGGSSVTGPAGIFAQSNWNNYQPQLDEPLMGAASGLIDSTGAATGVSIAWSANNTWAANSPSVANEDARLLDGYLDNSASTDVYVQVFGVPFNSYDLFVYVGSDGNGRTGAVSLSVDETLNARRPDVWYATSTGEGAFLGSGDYLEATGATQSTATTGNYVRYASLRGPDLQVNILRGSNNSGIHGIQIVQAITPSRIEVDRRTGMVTIVGGDSIPVDIAGYDISSAAGSLRPGQLHGLAELAPNSVDGDDAGAAAGDSPGEKWEVVYAGTDQVFESFLFGSTRFDSSRRTPLGRIFDPAVGDDVTLTFSYSLASGLSFRGDVVFVDSTPLAGDYNGDGVVNAADYTVWRDSLGSTGVGLPADGDGSGTIDTPDYSVWSANYASTLVGSTAVPEPGLLTTPIALGIGAARRRRAAAADDAALGVDGKTPA